MNLLTAQKIGVKVHTLSQKTKVGIGISNKRRKPPTKRFFYAQNLSSTFYVGLGRHSQEWPGRLSGMPTYSVRRHDWHHVVGFKTL